MRLYLNLFKHLLCSQIPWSYIFNQICFTVGDFGYARTIHEHSLRYTKVGTTAYLPPEVAHDQWRHARGYNKTVEYVIKQIITNHL